MSDASHSIVRAALDALGVDRFVLGVHDASLPSDVNEDIGRGAPSSRGALAFVDFAHALGFDGLQLGPQGITSETNRSPYDGTVFSRNPMSIDLGALVAAGLLDERTVHEMLANRPGSRDRVQYAYVYHGVRRALAEAHARLSERGAEHPVLIEGLARFRGQNAPWLDRDALFHSLAVIHGTEDVRAWDVHDARGFHTESERSTRLAEISVSHGEFVSRYRFAQFVCEMQHASFRAAVARRSMRLYGDLQAGLSTCDAWAYAPLLLRDYVMGAPPSRTTPAGQPWAYALLDPDLCIAPDGPGLAFLRARIAHMLHGFDGLRIDHPHALVCPWVYSAREAHSPAAVRAGARLFESPDLPDHPRLAHYARVRPQQIDPEVARWDDHRVRSLDAVQLDAYDTSLSVVMDAITRRGLERQDVLCEVLSTCPYPLARVMERHGLGRFRVTQKARLDDVRDVYRTDNADPADWVMLGTHDTEPIARVIARWAERGELQARADDLALRLAPPGTVRGLFAQTLASDPRRLMQAMLADLFLSPARHVYVFFADLFGLLDVYNVPGTVNDDNWTLRVPSDWESTYPERARRGEALNIPRALAMALRARGGHEDLAQALEPDRGWIGE